MQGWERAIYILSVKDPSTPIPTNRKEEEK